MPWHEDAGSACTRTSGPSQVRVPPRTLRGVNAGDLIYEWAIRLATPALSVAAPFSGKLRRGLEGRRAVAGSLRTWAAAQRDLSRPLVWLHAPSVGEAFMAQAVLAELRAREPRLQSVFTFFSPSAERTAGRVGADWTGYLPWDTRPAAHLMLDVLRPACIAFVRTEIWPVLVREAAARAVGLVMINAVLAPDSSRTGRVARLLLRSAYERLDVVGAVSDADAAAFPLLGVAPVRITVTGDARFDQVWQRVQRLDPDRPLLQPFRAAPAGADADRRPWLVAGSTWPADERRLIAALSRPAPAAPAGGTGWRAIIAPHEPDQKHVAALERRLSAAGLSHSRLHADDAPQAVTADVVVVDRVGVLADLYAVADAAYVGGGFGTAGLHSVVEPAALGVPVIYGPRHGNAQEAQRLAGAGGGFIAESTSALGSILDMLRASAATRAAAGAAARDFVRTHLGGRSRGEG
jgi:3-deoxy-D-manno-octulosonic-acid transferase